MACCGCCKKPTPSGPSVKITTPVTVSGKTATLSATVTNCTAPCTVTVDWGDGSPAETIPAPGSGNVYTKDHTYTDDKTYTIKVTVTDGKGQTASDSANVTIGGTPAAPTVTKLAPASGDPAGGNKVTITGTGFTGATSVKFGDTVLDSSKFTVKSDTEIEVTAAPAGTGTVDVTVTTPAGTSATGAASEYTYGSAPAKPTVSGVNPTGGKVDGSDITEDNLLTITGTGFQGGK